MSAFHLFAACALVLTGCARVSTAHPVEEAPYQSAANGRLLVRADLAERLVAAPARDDAEDAELRGFGHLAFAPGASYAVRSPFEGFVEQVHVEVGTRVDAGTLLATLRSSEVARMRAELRRLTATLDSERDALQRSERLVAEGAASEREVVESRGRIGALEAEVSGIRESLSAARTNGAGADVLKLRAAHAGYVLARNVEPGERVQASDVEPAFLVGDASALVVIAQFPERDASLLDEGARCSFEVPSLGAAHFTGTVTSVLRAIDPTTRSVRVICLPEGPHDPRLRAEMITRVSIDARGEGAIVVPRSAVLLRRDERVVLVRHGAQELERRVVTTGLGLGRDIQILSGLATGEQVVVDGAVLLDGELDRIL